MSSQPASTHALTLVVHIPTTSLKPSFPLSLSADPADMEGGEERGRETESRRMEWMNESGGREGRRGQTTSFLPQRERGARGSRREGTRLAIPPLLAPAVCSPSVLSAAAALSLYLSLALFTECVVAPVSFLGYAVIT